MSPRKPGRIVTFYSFKGGTGRTMAVANVAWILASQGRRVLVIDWDLEAPGLHRYFCPFLEDAELTSSSGLIDFFSEFAEAARAAASQEPDPSRPWWKEWASLLRYTYSLNWPFPGEGTVDVVPAGRQGPAYAARITSFDWQQFYEKLGGGVLLEALKQRLREDYDYILIDSRTGVSDTSGICTVQMPDDLVVCFTLNRQSVRGAAAVAGSAWKQRLRPTGEPSLRVWPVPMRVELAELERLELARADARASFHKFVLHLTRSQRSRYWGEVEVLYKAFFAYEEVLAVFAEQPHQRSSLLASFEAITEYVSSGDVRELAKMSDTQREAGLAQFVRKTAPRSSGSGTSPQVFLSYSGVKSPLAARLVRHLGSRGIDVFWDGKLKLGDNLNILLEQLTNSAAVIVLVDSKVGPTQEREIRTALDAERRIIPVFATGDVTELPPLLRFFNGFVLKHGDEEELDRFAEAVAAVLPQRSEQTGTIVDLEDPQKGQWGGRASRDGRRLSATVEPLSPDWFEVFLTVTNTDGAPLEGDAEFHLHPTFENSVLKVPVRKGRANLNVRAWGAFTVGASVDDGRTKLELNLADLPDAPETFRSR